MIVTHYALFLALVAALAVVSDAPAGGISDETCPECRRRVHKHLPFWNRGSAVLDQIQRDRGLGLWTRKTDVPSRLGPPAAGAESRAGRQPERHVVPAGKLSVLPGDARARGRPGELRRKANSEEVHTQDPTPALDRLDGCSPAALGSGSPFQNGTPCTRRIGHLPLDACCSAAPSGPRDRRRRIHRGNSPSAGHLPVFRKGQGH